ncbi:hypothetical protein [Acidithiobacillus marinus]|nr:hypothetical protein [Acidithiobacillus marinus]
MQKEEIEKKRKPGSQVGTNSEDRVIERPYKNFTGQEVRPYGRSGVPKKTVFKTTDPIDTCRYRDAYDRKIFDELLFRNVIIKGLARGRQPYLPGRIVLKNCAQGCRFCPHAVTFRLPNRKQTKKPTASLMLAAAPESEWRRKSHPGLANTPLGTQAKRIRKILLEEEKVKKLVAIETEIMAFTDISIDFLMRYFAEREPSVLQPYEAYFFCRHDLRDADICGPYQPLWGMRMDILLSMLRVAYRVMRYRLFAYYGQVLGNRRKEWSGLIMPSPMGRSVMDVPRWHWVYIFYVHKYGNLTEKRRKELRRNGEVYGVRNMPPSGPDYKVLGDPDLARFRRAILSAKEDFDYFNAIGKEADRLLWQTKKHLWDTRVDTKNEKSP